MKREVFLFLILTIFLISLVNADTFSIVWQTKQGEFSIGGTGNPITPPAVVPPTPPGGGPGPSPGGITAGVSGFGINNTFMLIRVIKGEPNQQQIIITNRGNTSLPISISVVNLSRYVFPSTDSVTLAPGETRSILINIYVSESEPASLLVGKVNFQSPNAKISVDLVLELSVRAPLFDIKTTLLKKNLFQGEKATANVKVLNLGNLKNVDVELESKIVDSKNNVYDATKETFAINDSAVKTVSLKLPENVSLGQYFFSSRVSYKNISASSYDAFDILRTIIQFGQLVFYLTLTIILVLITLISVVIRSKIRD
jgi:hypothetical protein